MFGAEKLFELTSAAHKHSCSDDIIRPDLS